MIIRLGGPTYENQVCASHQRSLAATAHELGRRNIEIELDDQHACPPSLARHKLFERALSSRADILWWADADVSWVVRDAIAVIEHVRKKGVPFVGIPYELRRGGEWSVHNGKKWVSEAELPTKPSPVLAMGLGLGCFNLGVFRERWSEGPWFVDFWQQGQLISEDVTFTSLLERKTGSAAICWDTRAVHTPRG